jgi:hypothetical protein
MIESGKKKYKSREKCIDLLVYDSARIEKWMSTVIIVIAALFLCVCIAIIIEIAVADDGRM